MAFRSSKSGCRAATAGIMNTTAENAKLDGVEDTDRSGGIDRNSTSDDALRLAKPLGEIDPETLPEEPGAAWEEVARRIKAYLDDRDGWRTGEIESTFDEFGGDDR